MLLSSLLLLLFKKTSKGKHYSQKLLSTTKIKIETTIKKVMHVFIEYFLYNKPDKFISS